MKTMVRKSVACVLLFAVLLVACSNTQLVGEPSNHSKYASALSLPKEEACKIIGIEREDMSEIVIETFATPLKAELAGRTFDVRLGFNALSEEEELTQIIYISIYPDQSDITVQGVDAIVTALTERYGEPSQQSDSWKEDEPIPYGYNYWDLTETVSQELSAYMEQLEEEYGGPAYYQMVLSISEDAGACAVKITYMVGVIPSKK